MLSDEEALAVLLGLVAGRRAGLTTAAGTASETAAAKIRRVLPEPWWEWIRNGRDKVELTLRRGIPPMRLYVGDQQVGEQPPSSSMEKIIIRAAQAAGTAAAAAIVSRAFAQFQKRGKAA